MKNIILVVAAFATTASAFTTTNHHNIASTKLNALPFETTELLAKVNPGDYGEYAKSALITLTLGGGLIPALISGNAAMIDQLSGKKRREEYNVEDDPKTSLDPTILEKKYRVFVDAQEVPGPTLAGSSLMFQNGPVKLVDVVAIMGRIQNVDSVADWKNLPSVKRGSVGTVPPMWLPRAAFKVNMRKASFGAWPVSPQTGQPVGGNELKDAWAKRVSKKGYMISDAALDAVWDSWSGGSGIGTPDKVAGALRNYHPNPDTLDLTAFTLKAIQGKSITALAAISFVGLQILAIGTLFVAPTLRTFFDVDVGFGDIGQCDPETCKQLF